MIDTDTYTPRMAHCDARVADRNFSSRQPCWTGSSSLDQTNRSRYNARETDVAFGTTSHGFRMGVERIETRETNLYIYRKKKELNREYETSGWEGRCKRGNATDQERIQGMLALRSSFKTCPCPSSIGRRFSGHS